MITYTTDDGVTVSVRPIADPAVWYRVVPVKHPAAPMLEACVIGQAQAGAVLPELLADMRTALGAI